MEQLNLFNEVDQNNQPMFEILNSTLYKICQKCCFLSCFQIASKLLVFIRRNSYSSQVENWIGIIDKFCKFSDQSIQLQSEERIILLMGISYSFDIVS